MDDSGAILCQISSFKDMLDQVNEEIEQNIQSTREIESETVKCSEIEKGYLMKEADLMKMVSMRDFELNGLIQVTATARTSVELMERELGSLKTHLDETAKNASGKREKFIVLCGCFQNDIMKGDSEELTRLFLEKEVLENEKENLNTKMNTLRNSSEEFVEDILEEIHSSCSALEVDVKCKTSELRELLKDIDELKILLRSMSPLKDLPVTVGPLATTHSDWGTGAAQSCEVNRREGKTQFLEALPTMFDKNLIDTDSNFTDLDVVQGLVEVMILPSQREYFQCYDYELS